MAGTGLQQPTVHGEVVVTELQLDLRSTHGLLQDNPHDVVSEEPDFSRLPLRSGGVHRCLATTAESRQCPAVMCASSPTMPAGRQTSGVAIVDVLFGLVVGHVFDAMEDPRVKQAWLNPLCLGSIS